MTRLQTLLGIDLPILQAPMAGVQGSALAIAVSNAGGLGAVPCAMSTPDMIRTELETVRAATFRPVNVNFFCHVPPVVDAAREAAWRQRLGPYYAEFGIDPATIPAGPGRAPFSREAADVLEVVQAADREFSLRPAGAGSAGACACVGREGAVIRHDGG